MTFADLVLGRDLLNHLDERQIVLLLEALDGEPVRFDLRDQIAVAAFVRGLRYTFGEQCPLARAIDEAVAGSKRDLRFHLRGAIRA